MKKLRHLKVLLPFDPLQDEEDAQGALELMYELKGALCEVTGMSDMTLQPAAGAHGEWTAPYDD